MKTLKYKLCHALPRQNGWIEGINREFTRSLSQVDQYYLVRAERLKLKLRGGRGVCWNQETPMRPIAAGL